MNDLLYTHEQDTHQRARIEILARWPDCTLEDHYSDAQEYTLDVDLPSVVTTKEWRVFLQEHDWLDISLSYLLVVNHCAGVAPE